MSNSNLDRLNFKNRVFSSYVVCSVVLIIKMYAFGIFLECFEMYLQVNATTIRLKINYFPKSLNVYIKNKIQLQTFASPEDVDAINIVLPKRAVVAINNETIERVRRL